MNGYRPRYTVGELQQVSKVCVVEGLLSSFKLVPECHTHPENQIRSSMIGFIGMKEGQWAGESGSDATFCFEIKRLSAKCEVGKTYRRRQRVFKLVPSVTRNILPVYHNDPSLICSGDHEIVRPKVKYNNDRNYDGWWVVEKIILGEARSKHVCWSRVPPPTKQE